MGNSVQRSVGVLPSPHAEAAPSAAPPWLPAWAYRLPCQLRPSPAPAQQASTLTTTLASLRHGTILHSCCKFGDIERRSSLRKCCSAVVRWPPTTYRCHRGPGPHLQGASEEDSKVHYLRVQRCKHAYEGRVGMSEGTQGVMAQALLPSPLAACGPETELILEIQPTQVH